MLWDINTPVGSSTSCWTIWAWCVVPGPCAHAQLAFCPIEFEFPPAARAVPSPHRRASPPPPPPPPRPPPGPHTPPGGTRACQRRVDGFTRIQRVTLVRWLSALKPMPCWRPPRFGRERVGLGFRGPPFDAQVTDYRVTPPLNVSPVRVPPTPCLCVNPKPACVPPPYLRHLVVQRRVFQRLCILLIRGKRSVEAVQRSRLALESFGFGCAERRWSRLRGGS